GNVSVPTFPEGAAPPSQFLGFDQTRENCSVPPAHVKEGRIASETVGLANIAAARPRTATSGMQSRLHSPIRQPPDCVYRQRPRLPDHSDPACLSVVRRSTYTARCR